MTIRSLKLAASLTALAAAIAVPAAAQMAAQPPAMAGAAGMETTRLIQVTIENLTTGQNFSPSFLANHAADAAGGTGIDTSTCHLGFRCVVRPSVAAAR